VICMAFDLPTVDDLGLLTYQSEAKFDRISSPEERDFENFPSVTQFYPSRVFFSVEMGGRLPFRSQFSFRLDFLVGVFPSFFFLQTPGFWAS